MNIRSHYVALYKINDSKFPLWTGGPMTQHSNTWLVDLWSNINWWTNNTQAISPLVPRPNIKMSRPHFNPDVDNNKRESLKSDNTNGHLFWHKISEFCNPTRILRSHISRPLVRNLKLLIIFIVSLHLQVCRDFHCTIRSAANFHCTIGSDANFHCTIGSAANFHCTSRSAANLTAPSGLPRNNQYKTKLVLTCSSQYILCLYWFSPNIFLPLV